MWNPYNYLCNSTFNNYQRIILTLKLGLTDISTNRVVFQETKHVFEN